MKDSWIGLLDCNNFFVSCERLFRPDLKDRPVVVLSSNDGCVVARSQEVKDMGVPMGVPYFKIKDTLEKAHVVTFSSHYALYRDISRRVFSVMRNELNMVEQYSVDEAFFSIIDNPEAIAERLKFEVERQAGIPVSVGISRSKTQAKYTNNMAKKSTGVKVLDTPEWSDLAPQIALSDIWGVGGKLELKYKQYGLVTVGDLLAVDPARIASLFGVVGLRLQQELAGKAIFKVCEKAEPQKSIISSRSFKDTTTNLTVLEDAMAYHVRHAAEDLRSMQMETFSIRVAIRPSGYGDFFMKGGSKEAILTTPTSNTVDLLKVATKLLEDLFEAEVPYKKVGITLSRFRPTNHGQDGLFKELVAVDNSALMKIVDVLNLKADRELVLIGSRLKGKSWQSRLDVCSPAYTTRWNDVRIVRT